MSRSKTYILRGDPSRLSKMTDYGPKTWDASSQQRQDWIVSLEKQHADEQWFRGPLSFSVKFYFDGSQKRGSTWNGQPHYTHPTSNGLVNSLLGICNKLLYESDTQVFQLQIEKLYGQPGVEFTISERDLNG